MPIDPSIPLGVTSPKIMTPFELKAQLDQVQAGEYTNRLSQMKMQEVEREQAERNALSNLYRNSVTDGKFDQNKLLTGVAGSDIAYKTPEVMKLLREQEAANLDIQGKRLSNDKTQQAITAEQRKYWAQKLGSYINDPALSKQRLLQDPEIQPHADFVQSLPGDPAQLRMQIQSILTAVMSPDKQFEAMSPKVNEMDLGGSRGLIDQNPNSPTFGKPLAMYGKTMSPGEIAADARARERNASDGTNKAPSGYRFTPNGTLEAIPGGPADIKAGELGAKREMAKNAALEQTSNVLASISDAKKLVGFNTVGAGGLLKNLPLTDARDLAAKLETIKANLGFDRLQQMRDASPTGGALGQVAVQELIALQSTVASLDQLQKPSQLKAALEKIEKHYKNWERTLKGSGASGSFADASGPARIKSDAEFDRLPSGATFIGPDGVTRRKP